MIKLFFKYYFLLVNNIYFYWSSIIFFILSFFYLLYYDYININNLIISLFISLFFIIYKIFLDLFCIVPVLEKLKETDIIIKFFIKFNEKVLIKNKWLIKPIYYVLYYFPTNWPFLIILWIGRKWWDIRLFINSNKDVIGKKYFNKDWSTIKSPFNNKYLKWIKKYIFDVLFRLLYIFLFLKINLLVKDLNKYFFYRIFGIIYSTVLIVNNLHIFVWFKNTEILEFKYKILICIFIVYLFLLFFVKFIDLLVNNVSFFHFLKLENKNLNLNDLKVIAKKNLWVNFFLCLKNQKISNYLYAKNFLIMLCLSEKYRYIIDCHYGLYMTKQILYFKSHVNLISSLIKLNQMENSFTKFPSFNDIFNLKHLEKKKFSHIDFIWLCEKNYNKISLFFMNFIFNIDSFFIFKMINYELYKTFYGEEIINKCFKEEIEEFVDIIIIYKLWHYWLFNKMNLNKDSINNYLENNYYNIPLIINNNNNYNNLLYSFNFILLGQINNLVLLNYYEYFDPDLVLHVKIIYSDIKRYEKEYGNDINKFKQFWMKDGNIFEDESLMKLRIEAFSKHIPNVNKSLLNITNKVEALYLENTKNKFFEDYIFILQKNFKNKYIKEKPILNNSFNFLEKYSIKDEWKYFSKKNEKMIFY